MDSILSQLKALKPKDAACLIGITMEDLYEGNDDSFVVGMAAGYDGVGVFSFLRYDPAFGGSKKNEKILLARSCKVEIFIFWL